IRELVRYSMDTMDPWPEGLILVGDGHYDVLNNASFQPVMIVPWIRLEGASYGDCSDDRFVIAHSGQTLPEMPVCRIPVDTPGELGGFASKLLGQLSGDNSGSWQNRVLFVADDEWGQQQDPQYANETEHTDYCEILAEQNVPGDLERRKFYLIEYPWGMERHPDKPEARADLIELFSEGSAFALYMGHGAAGQIAHEKVLLSSDIPLLRNGGRLPASMWATCDVGHFDTPGGDCIAEELVLSPYGGCISAIAATRGTYAFANFEISRALVDSIFSSPSMGVGVALWAAKIGTGGSYQNNRFYVFFGDMDLPAAFPEMDAEVLVEGDTLRSGESNTVSGSVLESSGLCYIEIVDSSDSTTYNCLGGSTITYLRYGNPAFRGSALIDAGSFSLECFIPLQADTGSFARTQAVGVSNQAVRCAALDPVALVRGQPSGSDTEGPLVEMWVEGYEGVEDPVVTGEVLLEADLSDESGICFLGGSSDRSILLYADGQAVDLSGYFSYLQGSTTSGHLSYAVDGLGYGAHTLILRSVDGVGNLSLDTLTLTTQAAQDLLIQEALVYPNPGRGSRCFSFRVSADADVTIGVYTLSGRLIRVLSRSCQQGYNQIMWDGLDAEGDEPATGAYVFRIEAVSRGSSVFDAKAEHTGLVAVIRE
ncbi:hypothetical protein JW921_10395, partial [Candidatus Fermentibacterales bacterium]|nr:hypothetical protein [Candidatus Fermentibacterales bacterium]